MNPTRGGFNFFPLLLLFENILLGWDCSPTQAALTPDFLDTRAKYNKPFLEMETQGSPMTADMTYATALDKRIPIHISQTGSQRPMDCLSKKLSAEKCGVSCSSAIHKQIPQAHSATSARGWEPHAVA